MRARRWALFIVLNIVVSILTTLGVLSFKGELERVVVVTATPGVVSARPMMTEEPSAPSAQAAQASPTPTPEGPREYTVQAGDTLGGIALAFDVPLEDLLLANNLAENDFIQPDQTLIIPSGIVVTPTPVTPTTVPPTPTVTTPTPFPSFTPTPQGPVEVRVQEVLSPGELAREGVVLINRGRTVNLEGWTLGAADDDTVYTFPRLTLARDVPVTVYTIIGDDSPQALHWGLGAAQWDESGTVIELRDAEGDLIATFTVE